MTHVLNILIGLIIGNYVLNNYYFLNHYFIEIFVEKCIYNMHVYYSEE